MTKSDIPWHRGQFQVLCLPVISYYISQWTAITCYWPIYNGFKQQLLFDCLHFPLSHSQQELNVIKADTLQGRVLEMPDLICLYMWSCCLKMLRNNFCVEGVSLLSSDRTEAVRAAGMEGWEEAGGEELRFICCGLSSSCSFVELWLISGSISSHLPWCVSESPSTLIF